MRWALVGVLVLLPLSLPPVEPGSAREVLWTTTVDVSHPERGTLLVTTDLEGLSGLVVSLTFRTRSTEGWPYTILNITPLGSTRIVPQPDGFTLEVRSDRESFRFEVDPKRPSGKGGEYHAYVGPEFALFRSESWQPPYSYTYYEGTPWKWRNRLQIVAPEGWSVETPFPQEGGWSLPNEEDGTFRGYVVLAPTENFSLRTFGAFGVEFRMVEVGGESRERENLEPFLSRATPYLRTLYGDSASPVVLGVFAPSPMYSGGLGAPHSFFARPDSPLRVVAHEYTHVYQRFQTTDRPGSSTIWVAEGDADLRSALALHATEFWSLSEVNSFLRDSSDSRHRPGSQLALTQARYGTDSESIAYTKGAIVLRALDVEMAQRTGGRRSLADLLKRLNDEYGYPNSTRPLEPHDLRVLVENLTGSDWGEFFQRYVEGSEWPPFLPVEETSDVVLESLEVDPALPEPGSTFKVKLRATNRGIEKVERSLDVFLDGTAVGRLNWSARPGESAEAFLTLEAPPPGDHLLRVGYLERGFRVQRPPQIFLRDLVLVPSTPRMGEPLDLLLLVGNGGDKEGRVSVRILFDGGEVGLFSLEVPPGGKAYSLPLFLPRSGKGTLRVEWEKGEGEREFREIPLEVGPPTPREPSEIPSEPLVPALLFGALLRKGGGRGGGRRRQRRRGSPPCPSR